SQPDKPLQAAFPVCARYSHRLRISEDLRVTPKYLEPGLQSAFENLVLRRIKPGVQRLAGGINDAVQPIMQPPPQIRKNRSHLVMPQCVRLDHQEPLPDQILIAPTV